MLAESLDGEARDLWAKCFSKKFNIGYEGGTAHQSYESNISSSTIERMAKNGTCFAVTVYPMQKE